MNVELSTIVEIAREAGRHTLSFFGSELKVQYKKDNSPLTQADLASNRVIHDALRDLSQQIPIISEETALPPYAARQSMSRFWIIDPLDGTKEFVKAVPEYTVNIALIEGSRPVMGAVCVPASDTVYAAQEGMGAFRITQDGKRTRLHTSGAVEASASTRIVTSRSHLSETEHRLVEHLKTQEPMRAGSAVKLCLVAEGAVDVYIRHKPIMEWDTAAGDVVLREAGGRSADWSGETLAYNKNDMRHVGIVATATSALVQDFVDKLRTFGLEKPVRLD